MTLERRGSTVAPTRHAATGLLSTLKRTVHAVITPLIPAESPVALIDFPNHPNVGDSLIWLGELEYLRAAGHSPVYTCDYHGFSGEALRRRIGSGTILLHGGGNVGDLHALFQRFRESVIEAFPHNRIVVLPQTVYFSGRPALDRARSVFSAHPDLTLLVRDRRSLDFARDNFECTVELCPDMAFNLGPIDPPGSPTRDVVWLARTDKEAAPGARPGPAAPVLCTDWPSERAMTGYPALRLASKAVGRLHAIAQRRLQGRRALDLTRVYVHLAHRRAKAGTTLLSDGRVVVTDRLHAHILATLLGRPSVVLDNSYGKVRSFVECWTQESALTSWADSADEALEVAGALVRGGDGLRSPVS